MQFPQALYLTAPLQLGEKGGRAVHIGHQRVLAATFQAPVVPLHLEMEHLGGEPVTVDLDDVRVILGQPDELGQRQGAVPLPPDPDLFFALQHLEQSGLTRRNFGIHTCTSNRY